MVCVLLVCSGLATTLSPLDERRVALLEMADEFYVVEGPSDELPAPNLVLTGSPDERAEMEKALTIFALQDLGMAGADRTDEANRVLRASLASVQVSEAGHMRGQYARAWNHRVRSLAVRLYALYADRLDEDVRAEFERRMGFMVAPPQARSSENIRLTCNSAYLLSHELLGREDEPTYAEVRGWLLDFMRARGQDGWHEWGSSYSVWSLGAVQNLAEFSQDTEVRELALMLVDYTLAQMAGFCLDGSFCSGAVRRYRHWTNGYFEPQTIIASTLFGGELRPSWFCFVEWAVSGYAPLLSVASLYQAPRPFEARLSTGGHPWRYRARVTDGYAISTMQVLDTRYLALPSGGTHDIVGCFVQSGADPAEHVVPYGHQMEGGPRKRRNASERYFGYDNVAFANQGGRVHAIWASGGVDDVPIRLFHTPAFRATLDGGWAFLSDGTTYVAWAPTVGDPILDPESGTWNDPETLGSWLRSAHVPGPEGETAVIEVGSAAEFGSYEAFRADITSRNPRPRVDGEGWVSYTARDGGELEFGPGGARVDGASVSLEGWPRAEMPGLADYELTVPEGAVRFDFATGEMSGDLGRMEHEIVFGEAR